MRRRAVSTTGSEQEAAVLRHLVRIFLKTPKQSTLDSFDTELFITEIEQLPAIWDSRSSSYGNKNGRHFFPMTRQPLGRLGLLIFRGFAITHFRHTTLG